LRKLPMRWGVKPFGERGHVTPIFLAELASSQLTLLTGWGCCPGAPSDTDAAEQQ